jgi:hypothetical protein
MRSWRTTVIGVLTIIVAVAHAGLQLLNGQQPDLTATSAGVLAGLGFIHAADNKALPPKP